MAVPRTPQALRLLVVALAVSVAVPRASAQVAIVPSMGPIATAATAAHSTLPVGSSAITQPASTIASTCGLTTTVQSTETVGSIISTYSLSVPADLAALNPGLDVMEPLTPGTSLCVGPIAWCNTALTASGVCPSTYSPLTDCSTASVALTTPLQEALTLTPDFCTILQDPETEASIFDLSGVSSLVMEVLPNNTAVIAVAVNPGHPHIALWLASGSTDPMVITIRPAWFADGAPFYMYVPGNTLGLLAQYPVSSGGSSSWLGRLANPVESFVNRFAGKRKMARKLLQGVDPPGGGGRGTNCGGWCYGR